MTIPLNTYSVFWVSRKRRPKTEDRRPLENEDPLQNEDLENEDP